MEEQSRCTRGRSSDDPRRLHWSCYPDDPDGHAGEGRSRTGKIAAKAAKEGKGMNQKGSSYLDWRIREWMHSWPKLPEGDKNEQMRLGLQETLK